MQEDKIVLSWCSNFMNESGEGAVEDDAGRWTLLPVFWFSSPLPADFRRKLALRTLWMPESPDVGECHHFSNSGTSTRRESRADAFSHMCAPSGPEASQLMDPASAKHMAMLLFSPLRLESACSSEVCLRRRKVGIKLCKNGKSAGDNIVRYSRSWLASPDEYRLCTSKSIPEPSFIVIHLECRGSTAGTNSASVYGAIQTISGHFLREDGARILKSVSRRFHRHWIHARTSDHGGKAMIAPICFLVVSRSFLARVVHVLPHFAELYAEHQAFRLISYVLYSIFSYHVCLAPRDSLDSACSHCTPCCPSWLMRVPSLEIISCGRQERQSSCRSRCACCLAWAPTAVLIHMYGI